MDQKNKNIITRISFSNPLWLAKAREAHSKAKERCQKLTEELCQLYLAVRVQKELKIDDFADAFDMSTRRLKLMLDKNSQTPVHLIDVMNIAEMLDIPISELFKVLDPENEMNEKEATNKFTNIFETLNKKISHQLMKFWRTDAQEKRFDNNMFLLYALSFLTEEQRNNIELTAFKTIIESGLNANLPQKELEQIRERYTYLICKEFEYLNVDVSKIPEPVEKDRRRRTSDITPKVIKEARRLYEEGLSIKSVARRLGMSAATLHKKRKEYPDLDAVFTPQ